MTPFSTLSRYASRSFLWSFFSTLVALAVIIAAFDFAELQRRTSDKPDVTYLIKLKMILLKAPYILEQVLPFLVFIAALYIFWRMNRNHELVVVRAAGVSVWQLVFPVMCTAWMVGALDLFVFNTLTSNMMSREIKMEDYNLGRHRSGMRLIKSGLWLREPLSNNEHAVYRIARVDLPKRKLHHFTAFKFEDNDHFIGRVDANSATLAQGALILRDVWKVDRNEAPKHYQILKIPTSLSPESIQNTGIHRSNLSFWQLPSYVALLKSAGLRSNKYAMYWHSMIARALWLGLMVLLAAAFTFRPVRTGRTLLMIMCGLFSGFALYFLRDFTYALGTSGVLSTQLAAALPPLFTGIVGATLLLYQEDG